MKKLLLIFALIPNSNYPLTETKTLDELKRDILELIKKLEDDLRKVKI